MKSGILALLASLIADAQGGREPGYALHLADGHPVFTVYAEGGLVAIKALAPLQGTVRNVPITNNQQPQTGFSPPSL